MTRAETLAGLAEAIAGHDFDNDRDHPTKGLYYCTCGEVIDVYIEKHHAAVALAWLEGHGWAEGDEEWGVQYKRDVVPMPDEETARKELRELDYARIMTLVRRRVTPWAPVETGDAT